MAKNIKNTETTKTTVAYDCERCGETTATVQEIETYRRVINGQLISSTYNDVKFCDTCGIADW